MNSRTVIITGGGTGIGAACAQVFAEQGDNVLIVGRRPEPLQAVAARTGAIAIVADVSTGDSWN